MGARRERLGMMCMRRSRLDILHSPDGSHGLNDLVVVEELFDQSVLHYCCTRGVNNRRSEARIYVWWNRYYWHNSLDVRNECIFD